MVPEHLLKSFPVFEGLPKAILSTLAPKVSEEAFPEGSVVFAEGKWGDALYLIAQGEIVIRKTLDASTGASKVVAVLGPGEFFGEMALLEDAPRSAAAVAHSPVVLFRLPREEFNRLLKANPNVALELLRGLVATLSLRLRQTTREMVAIFEVGRAMVQGGSARELAVRVLFQMRHSFEDDVFAAFYSWNEFADEYELWAVEGELPADLRKGMEKKHPFLRWLGARKECLLSPDWPQDERFTAEERGSVSGMRSLLVSPVMGAKGLMGVFVFGHKDQPGFFVSGHRQVVAGVSNLLVSAFENASLLAEEELKQRLRKSKGLPY